MATSYMDYTLPTTEFTYDLSNNPLFKKDENNYINALSIKQLNTLGNVSLLDIFLNTGNVVEPHTHQNATELVYCISGAAVVSSLIHLPTSFFISRLLRGRWLTFLKAGGTMKWPLQITRTYSQSLMLRFLKRYLAQTPYVLHLQNFWLIRTVWMRKKFKKHLLPFKKQ